MIARIRKTKRTPFLAWCLCSFFSSPLLRRSKNSFSRRTVTISSGAGRVCMRSISAARRLLGSFSMKSRSDSISLLTASLTCVRSSSSGSVSCLAIDYYFINSI